MFCRHQGGTLVVLCLRAKNLKRKPGDNSSPILDSTRGKNSSFILFSINTVPRLYSVLHKQARDQFSINQLLCTAYPRGDLLNVRGLQGLGLPKIRSSIFLIYGAKLPTDCSCFNSPPIRHHSTETKPLNLSHRGWIHFFFHKKIFYKNIEAEI